MMIQMRVQMFDAFLSCCAGRRSDYAVQQEDGRYLRAGLRLTAEDVFYHLQGAHTLGTYVINDEGLCHFALFDSDTPTGLVDLAAVQAQLATAALPSYLELSRRGAHLWVFLAVPAAPALLRAWLLPYCPLGVEFYPKQDGLSAEQPFGSLVRLPLGVHRLTGQRYPFVELVNGVPVLLTTSVVHALSWCASVQRATVPLVQDVAESTNQAPPRHRHTLQSVPVDALPLAPGLTIERWCLAHDPYDAIGRYVSLDQRGRGCCPFSWHHAHGQDRHPSFFVYRPAAGKLACWYCHTWQRGGSLFDFFRYYYGVGPRDLWQSILNGAQL